MANFHTHITASTLLGVGIGSVAHFQFGVPIGHSSVAGALCAIAGMLPDLDHKSGIPLRETLNFISVLIPMLMMPRFVELGLTPEQLVFVAGVMYVAIRFGFGALFRKFTKHRGMWHSIPAALGAGMITYLICLSPGQDVRLLKSWSVVLGFLLHLFLDEIYSVDLMGRRLKKSSGTAMKFFGNEYGANFLSYAGLIVLGAMIVSDGAIMESCCKGKAGQIVNHDHSDEQGTGRFSFGEVFENVGDRTREWVGEAFESPEASEATQQPFMR